MYLMFSSVALFMSSQTLYVRFNAFILLSTPQVLLESCIDIDSLLPYD